MKANLVCLNIIRIIMLAIRMIASLGVDHPFHRLSRYLAAYDQIRDPGE